MGWLKKFLRARRQKDSVKIMLLLMIAAVGFFWLAISRGVSLYRIVNTPVEYVASTSKKDLSGLENLENFTEASLQQEESRTVVFQGKEYQISCIALSEEYLSRVYQIQAKGVTKTFYINQPMLRQLGGSGQELIALCPSEETDEDGNPAPQLPVTVKCRLEEGIFDQENPLAFIVSEKGASIASSNDADPGTFGDSRKYRIYFDGQELGKSQKDMLEKKGFHLENQELFLETECRKSELLLQMKYEALIGVLLAAGSVFAYKYGKKIR